MNKIFRLIILISIGSYVLLLFAPYNIPAIYDQSTLNLLEWSGYGANEILLNYGFWAVMVLYLISALGLWFFINEARFLYLAVIVFDLLSTPFGGLWVQSGIDGMLSYISTLLDGIILYMAFMSPVSQQFKSVKALKWTQDDLMPASYTDELSSNLENLIAVIRKYKVASWAFALFVGFVFRYLYAIVKNSIFIKKLISPLFGRIDLFSELQIQILIVVVNIITEFTSSLFPAMFCGGLLVYLFGKRATELGIWSACMFIALGPRFLFFWQAPEIGLKISILMQPIIAVIVLASAISVITKRTNRITTGSTADRG
ncbi:MAG: hypothetical protein WC855_05565 [Thermodesulfovibrionales bacterium]